MVVMTIYRGVTSHFWARLVEWYAAGQALQFGAKLLQSGDTFKTSHAYDMLAAFAGEDIWGAVIVLVAAIRILCLFFNGASHGSVGSRPWGAWSAPF